MLVTVNGNVYYNVSSREGLMDLLQASDQLDAEIWLEQNGDPDGELPLLCVLKNRSLYCLYYLTNSSAGRRFCSYKMQSAGPIERVRFQLAAGDFHETYSTNCVDIDSAYTVMIEFLEGNGNRSAAVDWQHE